MEELVVGAVVHESNFSFNAAKEGKDRRGLVLPSGPTDEVGEVLRALIVAGLCCGTTALLPLDVVDGTSPADEVNSAEEVKGPVLGLSLSEEFRRICAALRTSSL
jgi:hypothetical protein